MKTQSQVWVFPGEHAPATGKQMVATFVDKRGHVATVLLKERRTVNSELYCTVCPPEVFKNLCQQRPKSGLRGLFLHHDNASALTVTATRDFVAHKPIQLLNTLHILQTLRLVTSLFSLR